jgi:hypothetical protein
MKKWYRLQIVVILAGTLFAWYTVVVDFMRFFDYHGTLFKITDCIIPNPVLTPCFWGAWGFIAALVWSILLLKHSESVNKKQHGYFTLFLVACTIFGWSNFFLVLYKFLANHGKPTIGCSGQITTNPFTTPCFYGSVFFLVSLIVSLIILALHRARLKNDPRITSGSSK